MSTSLRTIQSAMNASGWSVAEMNAFYDISPLTLQNYISATSNAVNTSTVLVDPFIAGASSAGPILGNCLMVELNESEGITANNTWYIEGHVAVTTTGAAGIKLQLTTYDGLTLVTAASNIEYTINVNAAVGGAGVVAANAAFGATVAAVSVDFSGIIQVLSGYGRIGLQFSQNASIATNTTLGPFGYIQAKAILP